MARRTGLAYNTVKGHLRRIEAERAEITASPERHITSRLPYSTVPLLVGPLGVQSQSVMAYVGRPTPTSYETGSPRPRPHDAGRPPVHPAEPPDRSAARRAARGRPQDRHEVAEASDRRGRPDGSDVPPLDRTDAARGGDRRRLPKAHAAPPRRLPRTDAGPTVLQPSIPHLTRSSLHRCLQRHGVSRLPELKGEAQPKKRFKHYPGP